MATELGAAYISLLPELSKFGPDVKRALGDVGVEADRAGKESGESFGEGFKGTASRLLSAAAAAGIGVVFMQGLNSGLEQGQDTAKLGARLGLSEQETARAGKIAGELYASNFGDSMPDVNAAIGSVMSNIDGMRGASDKSLKNISGLVLNTASVFEQDLGGVTRAVGQMMRTGLAPNAKAALDIITKGFQSGADRTEDYLDTLNEYGVQFKKFGIDGKTATGLLTQGLAGGAMSADKVADAVKEFFLLATDGSEGTADAYKALGLNASDMAQKVAAGGPAAKDALDQVITSLKGLKDPAKQAQIVTSLFGGPGEDLGAALFALDVNEAASSLGKVGGAAKKASDQMSDTPAAQWETFKRQMQAGFLNLMTTKVIPAMQSTVTWVKENKTWLSVLAGVVAAGAMAYGTYATVVGIVTLATKGWAAATAILSGVMRLNPIGLVVTALIALVAGLVYAWKNSETFRTVVIGVWNAIKGTVLTVVNWVKVNVPAAWNSVKNATVKAWNRVSSFISGIWETIKSAVATGLSRVIGIMDGIRSIVGTVTGAFQSAYNGAVGVVASMLTWVLGIPGGILTALGDVGSLLLEAGKAIINGLWEGLKSAWESVKSWFGGITDMIPDLKGPPKKDKILLRKAGRLVMKGFLDGLEDGLSEIKANLNTLTGNISKYVDKRYKGTMTAKWRKAHTKNVIWALQGEMNMLKANGKLQDRNTKAIERAGEKLKAMQEMSSGLAGSLRGELDLGSLIDGGTNDFGFGSSGSTTIAKVNAAVAGLAARARTFAARIKALFKAGMPKGLIQEIAGLGSEKGIGVADAILSGSKSQRDSLKGNWGDMESFTSLAGDNLAESWFGLGINAQQGLIKGLESQGAALDRAAARIAKRLTKKLKKLLGIHSPSRVLAREIGVPSGQGIGVGTIDGLDQMQSQVDRRVAGLTSVPSLPGADFVTGSALSTADEALVAEFVKALEGMTIDNTIALDGRGAARIVQAGTAGLGAFE